MNRHDINIITAEDTSFGIYVLYHPSELVRTRDHGSEAEYSEMTVEGVYYSDTDRPISEEHSKRLPYFGKEWLEVTELDWTRPASEMIVVEKSGFWLTEETRNEMKRYSGSR